MMIFVPLLTFSNSSRFLVTLPIMLTGLYGCVSPQKMQKAAPIGQYAKSPFSTVGDDFSLPIFTGMSKYTSSCHKADIPSIGSALIIASAVLGERMRMISPSAVPIP